MSVDEPVLMPSSMALHRDCGILAGDFIKPDPVLTRRETRKYLVAELERWLTGRICRHAKEISIVYSDPSEVAASVEDGMWPAARLYTVLYLLERSNTLVLPTDYDERFQFAAEWCIDICTDHLRGYEAVIPAAVMATGFVAIDKMPCGSVIESFWNHSPFAALRQAPPLTEAEDEAEAEAEAEGSASLDEKIEDGTLSVAQLLKADYVVRIPGWAIVTGFSVMAAYVWSVAVALSLAKHC